jgi:unsaturated rhamnogalacturonyl hydrolase
MFRSILISLLLLFNFSLLAQKGNDVTTPLHAMKVDYPTPYTPPKIETVKAVLDKVYNYLDAVTPAQLVHRKSGDAVALTAVDTNTIIKPGDFRLTSYEWGVTYSGMLEVGAATGDRKFTDYTKSRTEFIVNSLPPFKKLYELYGRRGNAFAQPIAPHALDDAGAVCAAMIKAQRAGVKTNLRPQIDHYMDYIFTKEFRFADGTIARNRPHKNTLWLDDLYMAIPAIAQMGKLTGDKKYYDDAVKQVVQYSARMFNKELNIYMHGWVEEMKEHPEFHWARANGWAIMAMVELLDVLPETHPGYTKVLQQLQAHAKGLASFQTPQGFWHQLLDKNDSYLETSATAIYAYCFARGINKGWLDAKAYAPAALLAWNAVATKVNDKGQVEGTCVGTGMAFDPAFYYYRPVNVFAAHGYGPVLLAGAEIINLLNNYEFEINDSSLQLKKKK